jgi:hypothetical protein
LVISYIAACMKKLEEIYTDTYSGLKLYYRDTNLPEEIIKKYTVDSIIREESYIAMSAAAGGLTRSCRFAIASNKAQDQSLITPGAAQWAAFNLEPNAYFKVLDIYQIDDQVQIFLLHFQEEYLEAFYGVKTNVEDQVIARAREIFEQKVDSAFIDILETDHWRGITEFPIGIGEDLEFIAVREIDEEVRNRLLKGEA